MIQRRTEQQHAFGAGLHRLPGAAVLSAVLQGQRQALDSLTPALPALERAADLAATALLTGGKLGYAGAAVAGVDDIAARAALQATKGAVKPAILVARGQTFDAAVTALAASGGKLDPYLS